MPCIFSIILQSFWNIQTWLRKHRHHESLQYYCLANRASWVTSQRRSMRWKCKKYTKSFQWQYQHQNQQVEFIHLYMYKSFGIEIFRYCSRRTVALSSVFMHAVYSYVYNRKCFSFYSLFCIKINIGWVNCLEPKPREPAHAATTLLLIFGLCFCSSVIERYFLFFIIVVVVFVVVLMPLGFSIISYTYIFRWRIRMRILMAVFLFQDAGGGFQMGKNPSWDDVLSVIHFFSACPVFDFFYFGRQTRIPSVKLIVSV